MKTGERAKSSPGLIISVSILLLLIFPVVIAIAGDPAPLAKKLPSPEPARMAPPSPAPLPQAQISVAISPASYGLTVSQSTALVATVANDSSNKGVTWSVSGSGCSGNACGTLSAVTSTSVTYTAPTSGGVYLVTATSAANVTVSAVATIGVTNLTGVFTYRNDGTRTSINNQEYLLTPSNVNTSSFGKRFSCAVDESVYAQPLWVANVAIGGGTHNIVIVVTQNDSVYAFDADNGSGTTCTLYWQASMLTSAYGAGSAATPIPPADTGETGDIPTEIGITSTPVIDPTTNYLYLVSNTKEGGQYYQRLHRLNLLTGSETANSPQVLAASVSGTGNGSSGGTLSYSALHQNQRPGLALVNGIVYMASGSHGDNEPWHGWILGYNASTMAFASAYCTTPDTFGGGIWMSGSAPVFDSSNNLFVITSNGTYNGTTDFADSFLKLSTTSGIKLSDWFTPDDQQNLGDNNVDLGQGGAVTLMDSVSGPYPHLLIGGGKEGVLYLINRDNMGHYNPNNNTAAVESWSLGGNMIAASGTFWQNTFYIGAASSPLEAFAFNTTTGLFTTAPSSQSNFSVAFPGLTPAISAAGTSNAILWTVDSSSSGTNGAPTGPAVLYAFDPSNLSNELWDSTQAAGNRDQAGNAVKFVVPTVANGKVYVAGVKNLTVYGLLSLAPATAAPTFSPLPGGYTTAQTVSLSDTTSDATIYYTLNGTTPTTSSSVYSGPINVPATTTIKAIAVAPGLNNSPLAVGDYTVQLLTAGISFVQVNSATPQTAQTTVSVPYAAPQFTGDLNVVVVGWNDVSHTVSSVKDSEGNVYTLAVGPTQNSTNGLSQAIYYAKNIAAAPAGANTVTVTFSGAAAYPDIRILEYSGVSLTGPVDITSSGTGNSASSSTTAVTTTNANDLLFAANMVYTTTTSSGTGFTSRIITVQDSDIAEDRFVTATGSYSATATLSSAGPWVMQMVAFSAVSTPGPTVASVSPSSGATGGGTAVTITGTNFASGATVTFGSVAATNVVVSNGTTITATTPAGSAGAANVTVTNPSGQSGSLANGFTYVAGLSVSSVSPSNGPPAGGTAVTITGTAFASGATVTIGGAAATNVVVVSATEITATTPAGSAGAVTVTVSVSGQNASLTNGFTYLVPPTVSSVSPNSGSTLGGTAVTITGANFAAGATVTFGAGRQGGDGTGAATNVVVVSSTQITCTTPANNAGAVTVAVTVNGETGSLTNGFSYVAVPTVSSVSPNNGPIAGGTAVTITGTNFAAGATVTFGSTAATNVVVVSGTQITATTPAGSAGAVTVTVAVSGQNASLANGFTYVVPATVSSLLPNSGSTAGGTAVTITGTNFAAGATVTFGSAAATSVVVVSGTQITATTPAGSAGAVMVTVTNPGTAGGSLANGFTYVVVPTVTSVSPNNGPIAGGTAVTITGTNFAAGATVTFGGTAATSVVVVSGTQITATTPAGSAGSVTVTVTVNGQSGSLTNGFTYNSAVAIGFGQVASSTPQSPTATVPVTFPASQTAGDLNIVVVGWNDTTSAVQSVKDSAGNTYNLAIGPTTGTALQQSIYYASNIAGGGNTVTVTFNQAAAYPDIRILEYRGLTTLDAKVGASGNSASASSGTATTTSANELIFGANMVYTTTGAAGSGFTSRIITPDGDIAEDKIVTVAGSNSATATLSSAGPWVMQMVTFSASGAVVGPTAPSGLTGPGPIVQTPVGYYNSNSQTVHTTAAFDSTGGDAIVVFASSHAGVTMTPSDTFNNTWISVAGPTSTTTGFDLRSQIWYAKNPTVGPGQTFTLTLSAAQPLVMSIFVVKGSNIPGPIDALSQIGNDGGSQSLNVASPSITTTLGNDLLIGFAKSSIGEVFTSGTGFTPQPVASSNFLDAETQLVAPPSTYSSTFTINAAATWQAAVVAVEPAVTSASSSQIALTWTASTDPLGVTGYLVERCQGIGCANFAQIGTATGTSFTDTGLTASTTYSYRVRATDAASNLSAYSNTIAAYTQASQVLVPTVTSVSPNNGPIAGGTAVTITGTNFAAGATVTFGSTAATNVVVVSGTQITATTPAGSAGAVTVMVTVNSQTGSLTNAFTYVVPATVSSVSPGSGSTAGGTAVTITGTNFAAGATVTFGSAAATNVVVVSGTQITATTPAGSAGAVTVTVTNPGTAGGSLANGFTYVVVPTVTSVSPNNGPIAGGTAVTITGTNFAAGATVTFGSTAATNVVVVSGTQITATTPAGSAGAVTVTVAVSGQNASLANAFTYVVPATVSSVSPSSGSTVGGTAVTITGTSFATGATVTFGGATATNVVVVSGTQITATTPAGSAGAVTVTVTNPGAAGGSLANGFTYVVTPTVTSVSPNNGPIAGGTAVTITGTNFAAGATVTFGGTTATNVVVVSGTQITATTPAHAAGAVTVAVNVNSQLGSLTSGFTYNAPPTVSSLSPNNGPIAGGTAVTITGTNFAAGATVTFGSAAAASVVVVSGTQITATSPAGSVGSVTVTVTVNSQSGSLTNGFTYNAAVAIGFGQLASATPQSPAVTVPVAFPGAQTAGDLTIVVVGWNDATATVQSVKDSAGNTYNLAIGPTAGTALQQSIYYAANIAGGSNTVTVTFSQAATYPDVRILEYRGVTTLDAKAGASGNSASASSGSATTTSANELIFGANTVYTLTGTVGSGFTSRIITPDGDIAEDKVVTAAGSNSATATLTSAGPWVMQMVTFK
jgi:hypothetical protein